MMIRITGPDADQALSDLLSNAQYDELAVTIEEQGNAPASIYGRRKPAPEWTTLYAHDLNQYLMDKEDKQNAK